MFFEAEKRISKSKAATQKAERDENKGDKQAPPGRYYLAVPKTRGNVPFPTFAQFQEEQAKKRGKK